MTSFLLSSIVTFFVFVVVILHWKPAATLNKIIFNTNLLDELIKHKTITYYFVPSTLQDRTRVYSHLAQTSASRTCTVQCRRPQVTINHAASLDIT